MVITVMYIIFALLGLGLLIFIHELGHFFVARWVGMRVEAFGIGFGKPIYTWVRNGVKWNLCWLPFGGYVKIAGMEKEGDVDPRDIPDGFFGKKPMDRIKVALAGPLANILLAFLLFSVLWLSGGREKPFSEFTHTIGWVDPRSELYAEGVRPGDQITAYNERPYQSVKDHVYAPLTSEDKIRVQGYKVNHHTGVKTPFDYTVKVYDNPAYLEDGIMTSGIQSSANYLIYQKMGGMENPLPDGSPMIGSGLEYGDRLYWVDGEKVFSGQQLSHIINEGRALVTVRRGNETILARVPRVPVEDLKLDVEHREEISDWQHQASLNATKLPKLYFIPYNLSSDGVVESDIKFIDKEHQEKASPDLTFSDLEKSLQPGDKIIAIDGTPIQRGADLLSLLQKRRVNIIVERDSAALKPISWTKADDEFIESDHLADLDKIVATIGTSSVLQKSGHLVLLKRVTPKGLNDFALPKEKQALVANELLEQRKAIEKIENSEKRARALSAFDERSRQLVLGIQVQDRQVNYNPGPVQLFKDVVDEIWRTLSALIVGDLSPKWLAGPVGMVQMLQNRWAVSIMEAIFWLAAISINLGILNLLPIPVLDGGHICMALFEMVTGKRLKAKTMERLIIPFAVLLICFMIFVTFHDLVRLFGKFLG